MPVRQYLDHVERSLAVGPVIDERQRFLLLDGQIHHDTYAIPMRNYVIRVGNHVVVSPSQAGNYKIADKAVVTWIVKGDLMWRAC
jgi:hypothetical protein